jgi:hypothetical protein
MSLRACLIIGLAWLLSLAAVTTALRFQSTRSSHDGGVDRSLPPDVNVGSSATSSASQARRYVPFAAPKVMSGEELGFRVEGMYGEQPVGGIVIRVNGNWVEAGFNPQTRPF